jgi:hypothetical protein
MNVQLNAQPYSITCFVKKENTQFHHIYLLYNVFLQAQHKQSASYVWKKFVVCVQWESEAKGKCKLESSISV